MFYGLFQIAEFGLKILRVINQNQGEKIMNNEKRSGFRIRDKVSMMTALLKSIPAGMTAIFIFAVILMNFLSRITLVSLPFLALNAGITVSWLSFLFMDVVTKHYGAKAANMMSVVAIAANLLCCLVCFIISRIWDYPALDMIVDGQWSILLASTIAYLISALSNNYTNIFIGKQFTENPDGKAAYAARTFISTLLSQILDNFIFVFLAFVVFPLIPGAFPVTWTIPQCLGASILCAFIELLTEMIFSPLGYYITKKWKKDGVGREYIEKYQPADIV